VVQKKSWGVTLASWQNLPLIIPILIVSSPPINWCVVGILWWDLKLVVAACKPKNITELAAIDHEELVQIPRKLCQKLLSGYRSRLQQLITAKGCSTKS